MAVRFRPYPPGDILSRKQVFKGDGERKGQEQGEKLAGEILGEYGVWGYGGIRGYGVLNETVDRLGEMVYSREVLSSDSNLTGWKFNGCY